MRISRDKLIRFYDERVRDEGRGSDVASITSLWGEDLILAVLQFFWRKEEGASSQILSYSCSTGKKSGPRLDAWILKTDSAQNKTLYQVEVKNWCAYSFGGQHLPLNASEDQLLKCSQNEWSYYFGQEVIPTKLVSKVMETMKQPLGYEEIPATPLLCFWFLITEQLGKHFSQKCYANGRAVHVFSASSYLRSLRESHIDVDMPRAERRLRLLTDMVSPETTHLGH